MCKKISKCGMEFVCCMNGSNVCDYFECDAKFSNECIYKHDINKCANYHLVVDLIYGKMGKFNSIHRRRCAGRASGGVIPI